MKFFQTVFGLFSPRKRKYSATLLYYLTFLLCQFAKEVASIGDVIWAINAGGDEHVDAHGIRYEADPLKNHIGIESDFGKRLLIQRAHPQDLLLYQTERYNDATFRYDIPLKKDGKYVLILKFCEVYFQSAGQKVFDVALNDHTVISELDIYAKVGYGVAHDEHVPFEIANGKLSIQGQSSSFDGSLFVEFIKGYHDNPKVNAIVVMAGTLADVPRLPAVPRDEPEKPEAEEERTRTPTKPPKRTSGPKTQNPYVSDNGSLMMPVVVAIGAFIPLLFCLCKL